MITVGEVKAKPLTASESKVRSMTEGFYAFNSIIIHYCKLYFHYYIVLFNSKLM